MPRGNDVLVVLALCLPCRTTGGDWHRLPLIRDHSGVSVSKNNTDINDDGDGDDDNNDADTIIGRIHGTIVAATGRSDRRGDCRGDRRRRPVYTQLAIVAATIAPCIRPIMVMTVVVVVVAVAAAAASAAVVQLHRYTAFYYTGIIHISTI